LPIAGSFRTSCGNPNRARVARYLVDLSHACLESRPPIRGLLGVLRLTRTIAELAKTPGE
jgi:hypothetical protein